MTTPIPFPLVQMARTFLFAYVFTLPFAMLGDDGSSAFAHCLIVFVVTYGFVGLELVAIELHDPFGDDENDFDNLGLAETAMEDAYLTMLDVDGREYAHKLWSKFQTLGGPQPNSSCRISSRRSTATLPPICERKKTYSLQESLTMVREEFEDLDEYDD